jgi:hemerythrin-like domain-containing protein
MVLIILNRMVHDMNATTTHPGDHLVAHFQSSYTHFPQYHAAALDLAAKAGSDTVAHARLVRLVAQYVQHLHIHHTAEEVELFPAIRRAAPDLSDSVDSLLDQHHELAAHLETVTF